MQDIFHIRPKREGNRLWRYIILFLFICGVSQQQAIAQMSIFGSNCVTAGQTYTYTVSGITVSASSQTYWDISGGVMAGTSSTIDTRPGISSISVIWNTGGVKRVNLRIYNLNQSASIDVNESTPLLPGSISGNASQTVVYKSTPATISCSVASGGGCPPVAENYQWQQSTDQSVWTDIAGADDQDLSFTSAIFSTTYFRRKVTSNSYQTGYSNNATVNVIPPLKKGTATPAEQYILSGATPAVISVVTTGLDGNCGGNYTYQWFSSPDGVVYTPIANATGTSYTPAALTQTTYYQLTVTCGIESTSSSPAIVHVNSPGIGSPDQNYILTSVPRAGGIANPQDPANTNVMRTVQYFDAQDRPLQAVQIKGSPSNKDIVQPFAYDPFGREAQKYLPYVTAGSNDGSYKPDALNAGVGVAAFYNPTGNGISGAQQSNGIVVIPQPFAQTLFEPSPLNRVVEQGAPGTDWQPSAGHTAKLEYTTNNLNDFSGTDTSASRKVVLYKADINSNQSRSLSYGNTAGNYYQVGQLYVTVSKNENWVSGRGGTTEEYKDKEGHVVLKRSFNWVPAKSGPPAVQAQLQVLSTYYVYDDLGNLAFVLPPQSGADGGITSVNNKDVLNNMCYQYRYDEFNRLTQKKIPGKGWDFTVYNKLDQPVLMQDSLQRLNNQWFVMKHDGFGRIIMTGLWNAGTTIAMSDLQESIKNKDQWDVADKNKDQVSFPLGYNIKSFPVLDKVLTINYYDDYLFPANPFNTNLVGTLAKPVDLPTATKVAVLNTLDKPTPDMLWSVYYYDSFGRKVQTFQRHYLGGTLTAGNYDVTTDIYENITNLLTSTKREHYTGNTSGVLKLTVSNSYSYDQMSRKLDTKENINNTGDQVLVHLDYNELGQVYKKNLHHVGSVNGTNLPADVTLGSADALTVGQQKTVLATSSIQLTPGFVVPSGATFNGQISTYLQTITYAYNERGWLSTSTAPLFAEQLYYNTGTSKQYNGNIAYQYWGTPGNLTKNYAYGYDQLNRLTTATASTGNHENGITYDLMGNINSLNRYATINGTNTQIDKLTYAYAPGTNMLQSVTDGMTNDAGQKQGTASYTYDGNGNLKTDDSKGITGAGITYNLLNLPQTINGKNTTYTYDATGQKLRRVIGTTITDYISGIQYDGTTTTTPTISFIQTEEGRAVASGANFNYEYSLTDHLGNSRVNFDTGTGTARKVQVDDYYAFGMEINGLSNGTKNNYLYNKKELQENLGLYDYGARFYDPVIGRWSSIDNQSEKYSSLAPYAYVSNNPIIAIDPTGEEKIVITGGANQNDKDVNPNPMMFVNAAKIQLANYLASAKRAGSNEQVSWLVYNSDYSSDQRAAIYKYAQDNGVNLKFINSADDVVNYVNSKSIDPRYGLESTTSEARFMDQITSLSVFSHGMGGQIALGYENSNSAQGNLDYNKTDKFSSYSFAKGALIDLFSCNSAMPGGFRGTPMSLIEAMRHANEPGSTVFSLTKALPQVNINGLIGQYQYGPVRSGNLPVPGHTGGNYSPLINGSSESPAIKVNARNGKVDKEKQ